MSGTSMNDIKARIKSVEGTMQITKAMELVATSKLRRAREKVERSRPYYEILGEAIASAESFAESRGSVWSEARDEGKVLYVVIAGDRGLAGGYNANIFRLTEQLIKADGGEHVILPVGKKACEYYKNRNRELFSVQIPYAQEAGVGASMKAGAEIANAFSEGTFRKVVLVYTKFASMISQIPVYEDLLPLSIDGDGKSKREPIFEGDAEELLSRIVPQYTGGILYSALCEALASESGARRTAMNSANKNAEEIIDTLMLKFNRARQAVITQEITEIVSGAEAL